MRAGSGRSGTLLVLSADWTFTGRHADPPTAVRSTREGEGAGFDAVMVGAPVVLHPDAGEI
ncbi:hypothetical protein [Streptomyces sp. NPDC047043]|uniref:hypothetical protein n=1 Tax=Streptomyces sp. NPDC047043 TaxID=3154497 RepID=UPI0033DFC666